MTEGHGIDFISFFVRKRNVYPVANVTSNRLLLVLSTSCQLETFRYEQRPFVVQSSCEKQTEPNQNSFKLKWGKMNLRDKMECGKVDFIGPDFSTKHL